MFTAKNLSIGMKVDGKDVVWHPGDSDSENLQGTTRTLDTARGSKTQEPIGQGLVSRAGWVLVDDSTRPLFDSADFRFLNGEKSEWPWVMERPANEKPGSYSDWYFFGYGHDYKQALGDSCAWLEGFRCRRDSRLACGGRATGRIPTSSSTNW